MLRQAAGDDADIVLGFEWQRACRRASRGRAAGRVVSRRVEAEVAELAQLSQERRPNFGSAPIGTHLTKIARLGGYLARN
jgi:hypothetical protein